MINKIVVCGALGHIGSRVIRTLPDDYPDAEFVLIDNLSSQRYCSLFDLPAAGRYRFLELDVLKADLSAPFRSADVVVHLAALTDAAGSFEMKERIERDNYAATERVAAACCHVGAKLINISSTSVYGTNNTSVDEFSGDADLRPQSPYAESKLKEERLLAVVRVERGLKFVTCRFGTIFGISPGMRFHTAVNKFCWQASTGVPITVWRTAMNQLRPYLDLEDAVRALRFVIEKDLFDGSVYNILSHNVTVADILEIIRGHVPQLSVEYVDSKIMNEFSYTVSNQRFRDMGFEFRGDLQRGIFDTMTLLQGARA